MSDGEGGLEAKEKVKEEPRRIGRGERGTPAEAQSQEERGATCNRLAEARSAKGELLRRLRLVYNILLGQSALFGHFGKGLEERQKKTEEKAAKKSGAASISSSSSSARAVVKGAARRILTTMVWMTRRESCWQTS